MRFSMFLLQTSHFVIFGLFIAKCDSLELLITPSTVLCLQQLTVTVANQADSFTVYLVSRGVTTAGDRGDASPVRPTMSPLHQSDNRHQFVFGADF